jgi:Kdo2-lipid IVA lauroyltransferase/acyltransferase
VAEGPRLRHRLEHAAVAGVVKLARLLPMRAVIGAGTLLGTAFYLFDRSHRRLAVSNLRAAFPSRSEAECDTIARGMFTHFGQLLTVLLKFSTMSPEEMLAHVEFEGEERVRAAHALGRGVLLFTGHFGFWEINALVHALEIAPMAVLARPLDNPLLHHLLESVRRRTGNTVIYRRGAIRRVLRALGDNQAVAFLIDQHIQAAAAVYGVCFSRPAATTSARRRWRPARAHRLCRCSRCRSRGAASGWSTSTRSSRRRGTIRRRCARSRSAAATCSRCTCGAIPICGCGCTAAGGRSTVRRR